MPNKFNPHGVSFPSTLNTFVDLAPFGLSSTIVDHLVVYPECATTAPLNNSVVFTRTPPRMNTNNIGILVMEQ